MLINRHIGVDSEDGPGIIGAVFQEELLALDQMGKKRIQVWINSPGGIVGDGWSIYNTILRTKTKVDTYCVGLAASIAGVIFQAGRNRIMMEGSVLMYHNPSSGDDADDEQVKALEAYKAALVTQVASRAKLLEKTVSDMMDKTSWILPSEALTSGLCDQVDYNADFNRKRMTADLHVMHRDTNKVINSIFDKTPKKMSFKTIANRLGLIDDANESSILQALSNIENRATTAEAQAKAKDTEIQNLTKTVSDKDAEILKLKNQLDAADQAKKDAEQKAVKDKAKAYVANLVKIGRVKNEAEAIEEWEKEYVANPERVEKMFGALTASRKAEGAITNEGGGTVSDDELQKVAAKKMQEVRNSLGKRYA